MRNIKFDFDATKQNIFVNQNASVPVGAPVDQSGAVANNGNAIGIVIGAKKQVISGRFVKNLVVMVAGYCDIIDAQEIWGDEYSAEAMAAMSDIIFCDDHKIGGGGGWPADLPKPSVGGYGYTEQGWTTLVSEAVTTTVTAQMPFAYGEFATSGLEIKDGTTYKVVFNGTEYELTAVEDNGQTYIGELDETRMPNFNTYPFCILQDIGDSPILMATVSSGTHDVTVQWVADTVHKIDEKYLPSGGAMVVNMTYIQDGHIWTADKSISDICESYFSGRIIIAKMDASFARFALTAVGAITGENGRWTVVFGTGSDNDVKRLKGVQDPDMDSWQYGVS